MAAYYNENDPYAAQWLRNLIAEGHIADGVVDERSIKDVEPDELGGFLQCHFFAGIGVWSLALRHAGWPDDRPVWTGSCPCQPFSVAGKGKGAKDDRHLWPTWFELIEKHRPGTVFGEQVASKDGLGWLDLVQADMEGTDYAIGAVDTCVAGFGSPHIRQRLYFVAERVGDAERTGLEGYGGNGANGHQPGRLQTQEAGPATETGGANGLGDAGSESGKRHPGTVCRPKEESHCQGFENGGVNNRHSDASPTRRLANDDGDRRSSGGKAATSARYGDSVGSTCCDDSNGTAGPTNGFWRASDWLFCRDGKWRPVEPGTFPLAHGAAARVGRLRAYGNAISPQAAAAFIESYIEVENDI